MISNNVYSGLRSFGKKALLAAAMACVMWGSGKAMATQATVGKGEMYTVKIGYSRLNKIVTIDSINVFVSNNLEPPTVNPLINLQYSENDNASGGALQFKRNNQKLEILPGKNYLSFGNVLTSQARINITMANSKYKFSLTAKVNNVQKNLNCKLIVPGKGVTNEAISFKQSPSTIPLLCNTVLPK